MAETYVREWFGAPRSPPPPVARSRPSSITYPTLQSLRSFTRRHITPPVTTVTNTMAAYRRSLGMTMAQHVLPADVVRTIDKEILNAEEPVQDALVGWLVRSVGDFASGWAIDNIDRVFVITSVVAGVGCGMLHAAKACTRWLARLLRIGRPVTFVTDVLLPTGFFGPFLALYVLVKIAGKARMQGDDAAQAQAQAAAPSASPPSQSEDAGTPTRSRGLGYSTGAAKARVARPLGQRRLKVVVGKLQREPSSRGAAAATAAAALARAAP